MSLATVSTQVLPLHHYTMILQKTRNFGTSSIKGLPVFPPAPLLTQQHTHTHTIVSYDNHKSILYTYQHNVKPDMMVTACNSST